MKWNFDSKFFIYLCCVVKYIENMTGWLIDIRARRA